jgi:hypothetical protein
MSNLDDLITTTKNGVVAVNALTAALSAFATIYNSFIGDKTFLGATSDNLVSTSSGRLVNLIVSVAGSAGTVHDAATVAGATSSNVIAVIPATAGVHVINVPFTNGLVIKPGASQTVGVTYA